MREGSIIPAAPGPLNERGGGRGSAVPRPPRAAPQRGPLPCRRPYFSRVIGRVSTVAPLRTRLAGPLAQVHEGRVDLGDAPGLGVVPDLGRLQPWVVAHAYG